MPLSVLVGLHSIESMTHQRNHSIQMNWKINEPRWGSRWPDENDAHWCWRRRFQIEALGFSTSSTRVIVEQSKSFVVPNPAIFSDMTTLISMTNCKTKKNSQSLLRIWASSRIKFRPSVFIRALIVVCSTNEWFGWAEKENAHNIRKHGAIQLFSVWSGNC